MKRFNLEEYKINPDREVVTREGEPVRILCTDADCNGSQIVAIVTRSDGENRLLTYYDNGQYYSNREDEDDLFFAPNKKEGWVNIYYRAQAMICGLIHQSEERAKQEIDKDKPYITTTKIEWEE